MSKRTPRGRWRRCGNRRIIRNLSLPNGNERGPIDFTGVKSQEGGTEGWEGPNPPPSPPPPPPSEKKAGVQVKSIKSMSVSVINSNQLTLIIKVSLYPHRQSLPIACKCLTNTHITLTWSWLTTEIDLERRSTVCRANGAFSTCPTVY